MASNKTTKISTSNTSLPIEIILEIFSRLPGKSLHRLRSILDDELSNCIKTYSFTHEHAFNVVKQSTNEHLMMVSSARANILKMDSTNRIPNITKTYNFDQVLKDTLAIKNTRLVSSVVIGTSNGIICLYFCLSRVLSSTKTLIFLRLVLWNPCTGEHHVLPEHPTDPKTLTSLFNDKCSRYYPYICGFGYDAANKTYKLITIEKNFIQVYDLSTDLWKFVDTINIDVDNILLSYSSDLFGKYLNGTLHWIISTPSSTEILAIDLSIETSSRLRLPRCCSNSEKGCRCLRLGIWKGCLSVSCYRTKLNEVSLWVLKEYGSEESWVNIWLISLDTSPWWVSHNEEIMFVIERTDIFMYHENRKVIHVKGMTLSLDCKADNFGYVKGLKLDPKIQTIVHVDTLVSPKPEAYRLANTIIENL